jgi:hypothetical protein
MFPGLQVVCEVCETSQEPASECVSCGMKLHVPAGVPLTGDPVVERPPGLEPTRLGAAPDLPAWQLPDLETTVLPPTPRPALDFVPGFEPTEQSLLDLPGDDPVLPGLERTTSDFDRDTPRGPVGVPATCPYCAFTQREGRVCNNCGRSKLRVLEPPPAPGVGASTGEKVRCRSCGTYVKPAKLCSDCGRPLPPA